MINLLAGELGGVPFNSYGAWTHRVAKGELPKTKPERPQGIERNIVVTTWDWANESITCMTGAPATAQSDGERYGRFTARPNTRPTSYRSSIQDPHRHHDHRPGGGTPYRPRRSGRTRGQRQVRCRRPIGATRRSGTPRPTTTTACPTRLARLAGSHLRAPSIPTSARRARTTLAKLFPLERSNRQVTILDPKTNNTRSSTPASSPITCSSGMTPTTPYDRRRRPSRRL